MLDRQGSRFVLEVLLPRRRSPTGLALAEAEPARDHRRDGARLGSSSRSSNGSRGAASRTSGPGCRRATTCRARAFRRRSRSSRSYAGYPDPQREEAPTWIASAAVREQLLGRVAGRRRPTASSCRTSVDGDETERATASELPPAPAPAAGAVARAGHGRCRPLPAAIARGLRHRLADPARAVRADRSRLAVVLGRRTARRGVRGRGACADRAARAPAPATGANEHAARRAAVLRSRRSRSSPRSRAVAVSACDPLGHLDGAASGGLVHGARGIGGTVDLRAAHGVRHRSSAPTREGIAHPTLPCGATRLHHLRRQDTCSRRSSTAARTAPGAQFDLTDALARRLGLRGVQTVHWATPREVADRRYSRAVARRRSRRRASM